MFVVALCQGGKTDEQVETERLARQKNVSRECCRSTTALNPYPSTALDGAAGSAQGKTEQSSVKNKQSKPTLNRTKRKESGKMAIQTEQNEPKTNRNESNQRAPKTTENPKEKQRRQEVMIAKPSASYDRDRFSSLRPGGNVTRPPTHDSAGLFFT